VKGSLKIARFLGNEGVDDLEKSANLESRAEKKLTCLDGEIPSK
jgi:hypothetical protein